jgi:hypothetical protein
MKVRLLFPALCLLAWVASVLADPPVRVEITDDPALVQETFLPIDPQVRAQPNFATNMTYQLLVEGKRLNISVGSANRIKLDGKAVVVTAAAKAKKPLPPGPDGKARVGVEYTWSKKGITITQVAEVVPGKPSARPKAGEKRRMDTLLIRYTIENSDTVPHTVGLRLVIGSVCNLNNGCLFASPEKFPNKLLDGTELKDKNVPDYLQILEKNDLKKPGWITHFTLRFGPKWEGPNRVILTSRTAADTGWDIPAMPSNGNSEAAFFWDEKPLKPGEKRELAFAHGQGIASGPGNAGRVGLDFSGSFDAGKQFTITATVDDPAVGQALTLELPDGLNRVEGAATQTVPAAVDGQSVVVWKVRVDKLDTYALKVRSSNGVVYNTMMKIEPSERAELIRIRPNDAEPEPAKPMDPGKKKKGKDPQR